MKTIKLLIILCICSSGFQTLAQNNTEFKSERKYGNSFYDEENLKLLKLNDTLNVFINEEKKVSFLSNNISKLNRFEGFEKEIDTLFILFDQLDLDFVKNAYDIIFSPPTKELLIKKNDQEKFIVIGGQTIPTKRHNVTFVYRHLASEIKFYLGEIDELKVLKEAGLSDRVKSLYELNDWGKKYSSRVFNKDLIIKDSGEQEIISYRNLEKDRLITFNVDLGVNSVADRIPTVIDFSVIYYFAGSKYSGDFGVGAFYKSFNFYSKDDDNNFKFQRDGFLGGGFSYSKTEDVFSLRYGRLVRSSNSFFDTFKNNLGFEVSLGGPFKINIDYVSEKMFSGRTMVAFGITTRFL